MEAYGLEPQVVLTTPLLLSWDGAEDELVGREQHPADDRARGAVRPDDADPRRAAAGVVPARRRAGAARTATRWRRSSSSRASSWRARTARRPARAAEEHFTRVVREGQAPEDVPEVPLPDGDPVHLPKLLVEHGRIASTSEARRLIAQGAVKIDGEPWPSSTCRATRLDGALLQVGKRRWCHGARPPPLDRRAAVATIPGLPRRTAVRKSSNRQGRAREAVRATTRTGSSRASGASRGLFYGRSTTAPVFENSTACVYVETSTRALRVRREESMTSSRSQAPACWCRRECDL